MAAILALMSLLFLQVIVICLLKSKHLLFEKKSVPEFDTAVLKAIFENILLFSSSGRRLKKLLPTMSFSRGKEGINFVICITGI